MSKESDIELQEKIICRMDLSRQMTEDEIWEMIDEQIRQESKKRSMEIRIREQLRKNIFHAIRQLGILQELIEDPEITEIMVNGTEGIFIEKDGRLRQLESRFETKEKLKLIFENKELRMLFNVTRKSTPQRLMAYYNMIKELESQEHGEE